MTSETFAVLIFTVTQLRYLQDNRLAFHRPRVRVLQGHQVDELAAAVGIMYLKIGLGLNAGVDNVFFSALCWCL